MPEMSRSQVVVYAAVAVALLLVGARAIRGEGAAHGSFAAASDGGSAGGSSFSISGSGGEVVVDVTGAVRDPGVYRMPAGSRVDDAGTRAGGAAPAAELEAINLAARLADGQQVVVPKRVAGGAAVAGSIPSSSPSTKPLASSASRDGIPRSSPLSARALISPARGSARTTIPTIPTKTRTVRDIG